MSAPPGKPAPPVVRRLAVPRGSFHAAWVRDPGRFSALLPNPFPIPDPLPPRFAGSAPTKRAPQGAMVRLIGATNRAWGGDAKCLAAAESLRDPGALAVVTGQQAGLFGGPLYSLAKGLSAVALARRLAARTGRPVVPVFWIEGDDADFEEIRHATVLDAEGAPRRIGIGTDDEPAGIPAFRRRLGPETEGRIDELAAALPQTSFTEPLIADLRRSYDTGATLTEAFGRFLLESTRGTGLVVFDPTGAEVKRLARPVFLDALSHRTEALRRIGAASVRIAEAGFRPQAAPEGYCVFHLDPSGSRKRLTDPARLDDAGAAPSAAVLLRPLVQDYLLPTVAYVGGPAEVAYHAQIGGLYDLHRIRRPFVVPRHLISVLTRSATRVLDGDGIPFDELSRGDESALNRAVADPAAQAALDRAKTKVRASMREVANALAALDGSLRGAARKGAGRMLGVLGKLEGMSVRSAKRLAAERRARFLRARGFLFPGGVPQERRLSPLVFLNLFGPGFPHWLLAGLSGPDADRTKRNLLIR